jgi:tRNA(adenine34) deaminase
VDSVTQQTTRRDKEDEHWMLQALLHAEKAALKGEIPVGAVLIDQNGLLAAAGNSPISHQDPTAHAEILVMRSAAERLRNYRLPGTTLYVTLEPCIMCMGAMVHARIDRLVYGAADPKTGAADSVYTIGTDGCLNHRIVISRGILAEQCSALLKTFFKARRKESKLRT